MSDYNYELNQLCKHIEDIGITEDKNFDQCLVFMLEIEAWLPKMHDEIKRQFGESVDTDELFNLINKPYKNSVKYRELLEPIYANTVNEWIDYCIDLNKSRMEKLEIEREQLESQEYHR